jgi:phosphoglucan,water dikinase
MIYIGNQTACWAATPMEPFEYAIASGFDAFEWFPDKKPGAGWDESDLGETQRKGIREAAAAHGIRLSVHAHWQANPDMRLFLKDMALARDLGATLFNIHLDRQAGIAAYVEAIEPLIRCASETGLQLAIENTPHHSPEDFNELFSRLLSSRLGNADTVGMCLDVGHANLCAATRNDYLKFIDLLDASVPLIHLHLHENRGDADSHLPIFTGPSQEDDSGIRGLIERLRRRGYAGSIILEQWPSPPGLLKQARDRLLQMLGPSMPSEIKAPLNGPTAICGDFERELIDGNRRCRSWREKLDFVHELLARETAAAVLTSEKLVSIAVFLRYLGVGEIPCAEDGRHFRPSHHARIALQIRNLLSGGFGAEYKFIVRQILPWLPSAAREFQRAEPLTRIRDIAHRNDIPSELKAEIKHTLQNKLHRCAGPEDLVASRKLLERITAPGANYSSDFVEQFKMFHEELKEFFNARFLVDQLTDLLPQADEATANAIRLFLSNKENPGLDGRLKALGCLTELRRILSAETGHLDAAAREYADIGLEDFAFTLLSDAINRIEQSNEVWLPLFESLVSLIENLILSGIEPEECQAVQSELLAWRKSFDPGNRDQMLRFKATADRGRRLAEAFSARILTLFQKPAERLGYAFGVSGDAVKVFCEAAVRRHLAFQLSKVASSASRRIRERLALPVWDVLVGGQASGQVKIAASLDALGGDLSQPVIAILDRAEGDEEIPKSVAGIVLAHEIPHLSHLAVRARQAGVVFVACEEPVELNEMRRIEGRTVSLVARPDKVAWNIAEDSKHQCQAPDQSVSLPEVSLKPESLCMPLEQVAFESGGGKGRGARLLAELARSPDAGFRTPLTVVVPFGVMESAFRAAPQLEKDYRRLLGNVNGLAPADIVSSANRMNELIRQIPVPEALIVQISQRFQPNTRFIVRSSANCEDLDALAGAGLYESVANVGQAGLAAAIRAVWASLWTRRAALSRKQAGIPHEKAHMAVLVQQLIEPDFSFVLHTTNPTNRNPREIYAEIAAGLGETLASASVPGNPYRIVCDKITGAVTILAFANFSHETGANQAGGLSQKTLDYSRIELSRNPDALRDLGKRLARISCVVEAASQRPQDIEGAVVGEQIFLVQARAQQGLTRQGDE